MDDEIEIDPTLVVQLYEAAENAEADFGRLEFSYQQALGQIVNLLNEYGEIAAEDPRRFGPVGTFAARLLADETMTRAALIGMCAVMVEQTWKDLQQERTDRD